MTPAKPIRSYFGTPERCDSRLNWLLHLPPRTQRAQRNSCLMRRVSVLLVQIALTMAGAAPAKPIKPYFGTPERRYSRSSQSLAYAKARESYVTGTARTYRVVWRYTPPGPPPATRPSWRSFTRHNAVN